jgi:hypothetical protein
LNEDNFPDGFGHSPALYPSRDMLVIPYGDSTKKTNPHDSADTMREWNLSGFFSGFSGEIIDIGNHPALYTKK